MIHIHNAVQHKDKISLPDRRRLNIRPTIMNRLHSYLVASLPALMNRKRERERPMLNPTNANVSDLHPGYLVESVKCVQNWMEHQQIATKEYAFA